MELDSDQREICDYLKSWPKQYISAKEICRRAGGKKRFQEEPRWAMAVLVRMVDEKILETDSLGHYRLRDDGAAKAEDKRKRNKKWVSPQIEKILKQSGKRFDLLEEPEETPRKKD